MRDHLGDDRILETMAEMALQETYPTILKDEKIDAIGRPEVQITKLANGNPLGFKITTAVYPKFDLPDYQSLVKAINTAPTVAITIEEKEIDDLLAQAKTPPLPTREQIKNYLTQDKTQAEKDKRRVKILDAIIAQTPMVLPKILIETELNKMLEEMKANIVNLGGKPARQGHSGGFEDYLAHLKKTEAELKTDWQESAVKRVKSGLILEAIAIKEKIAPAVEAVETETKRLLERYPKTSAGWRTSNVRAYVVNRLTNEEVFKHLEAIK